MTTKKRQQSGEEIYWPAKLKISKDIFKKTLEQRIKIWNELLEKHILSIDELDELIIDYSKWNEWNKEYLKQSFNYQDNQYFIDYKSSWIFFISSHTPSLPEKIKDKKNDIKKKINKLDQLLNKADLIPIDENIKIEVTEINHTKNIINIMKWFHKCAQELRHRHSNRETIILNDEYDVQDLLISILKIFYSDVRPEDYSPSSAWWNSRIDIVLPNEDIIIETKMTSERLKDKEAWEQIAIDIVRYQNHPNYKTMIVFIYDKWDFIRNKRWLIQDLEKQSKNWKEIIVIINPE